MSGFLLMKTGPKEWCKRYVIVAGYTLAWFRDKKDLEFKRQPMGCLPLNECRMVSLQCHFSVHKTLNPGPNSKDISFGFKAESEKLCRRWVKCLRATMEECTKIMPSQEELKTDEESHSFGLYRRSLSFFQALQSGAIYVDDDSSDIDQQSASISSPSEPDEDGPRFYSAMKKQRDTHLHRKSEQLRVSMLQRPSIQNLLLQIQEDQDMEDQDMIIGSNPDEFDEQNTASRSKSLSTIRSSGLNSVGNESSSQSIDLIRASIGMYLLLSP